MEFKSYLEKLNSRINLLSSLFNKNELSISFNELLNNKEKVNYELLYIDTKNKEEPEIFIFGFDFFLKDYREQEFKRKINQNSLNFKILGAYNKLKNKNNNLNIKFNNNSNTNVKISDILNEIQNEEKDSIQINNILERILTLAYYLNWDLKKDKNDLEDDSFIEISTEYLTKLKQRFDFNMISSIYEDSDLFVFLNSKCKVNIVLKNLDYFLKEDVIRLIPKTLNRIFEIKEINFK